MLCLSIDDVASIFFAPDSAYERDFFVLSALTPNIFGLVNVCSMSLPFYFVTDCEMQPFCLFPFRNRPACSENAIFILGSLVLRALMKSSNLLVTESDLFYPSLFSQSDENP